LPKSIYEGNKFVAHALAYKFFKMSFKLKLNINTGVPKAPSLSTPLATPLATPGGSRPTLKLTNKSAPPTPAAAEEPPKPKKTKAGRATKPSAKIIESRKRVKEESDEEDTIQVLQPLQTQQPLQPPSKKIKLNLGGAAGPKTPSTPVVLKAKVKGKPPKRPLGEGYDSEASDREIDPTIEEEFVLRMVSGNDAEYLRQMIIDKKIGLPKGPPHHGADIQMKFFQGEGRRAAITIRKNVYAATMVDLPTVIEGMKSWDKRNWLKSGDICQMLWVFAQVKKEEEAKTIPLPPMIDPKTHQFPHGLTPPMQYARRNRFRSRLHKTQIEEVEAEVDRLLKADEEAVETIAAYIDPDEEERRESQAFSPASSPGDYEMEEQGYSGNEDAEGEVDDSGYFGHAHTNGHAQNAVTEENDFNIDADLEAAFDEVEEELDDATPMSTVGATPSMANGAGSTPMEEFDSGDESMEDGDDGDEDEGEEEIDEEERARLARIQGTMEDIADLEKQITNVQTQLASTANPILRRRLEENSRKLKEELQLKKSSIEQGEENE
jgi:transcription initiation factor TFIID subunit 7